MYVSVRTRDMHVIHAYIERIPNTYIHINGLMRTMVSRYPVNNAFGTIRKAAHSPVLLNKSIVRFCNNNSSADIRARTTVFFLDDCTRTSTHAFYRLYKSCIIVIRLHSHRLSVPINVTRSFLFVLRTPWLPSLIFLQTHTFFLSLLTYNTIVAIYIVLHRLWNGTYFMYDYAFEVQREINAKEKATNTLQFPWTLYWSCLFN